MISLHSLTFKKKTKKKKKNKTKHDRKNMKIPFQIIKMFSNNINTFHSFFYRICSCKQYVNREKKYPFKPIWCVRNPCFIENSVLNYVKTKMSLKIIKTHLQITMISLITQLKVSHVWYCQTIHSPLPATCITYPNIL